jgi:hypothetical protein
MNAKRIDKRIRIATWGLAAILLVLPWIAMQLH